MNNINEIGDTPKGQYALGRVAGRAAERKEKKIEKENFFKQLEESNKKGG